MLQNIIKNVSLSLPEGYALMAGSDMGNMAWYYELVQASMLASPRGFIIVLTIPLTDVNRRYELYRTYSFYSKLSNHSFVRYAISGDFFAVNVHQQTHFTMTESELLRCKGQGIKVCPATRPVFSVEQETCPWSLYMKLEHSREVCSRQITTVAPHPTLERQGTALIYHFMAPIQVFFRCHQRTGWTMESLVLEGPGALPRHDGGNSAVPNADGNHGVHWTSTGAVHPCTSISHVTE
jgi:hypothetical protein